MTPELHARVAWAIRVIAVRFATTISSRARHVGPDGEVGRLFDGDDAQRAAAP
jgi:hypothetical protein